MWVCVYVYIYVNVVLCFVCVCGGGGDLPLLLAFILMKNALPQKIHNFCHMQFSMWLTMIGKEKVISPCESDKQPIIVCYIGELWQKWWVCLW